MPCVELSEVQLLIVEDLAESLRVRSPSVVMTQKEVLIDFLAGCARGFPRMRACTKLERMGQCTILSILAGLDRNQAQEIAVENAKHTLPENRVVYSAVLHCISKSPFLSDTAIPHQESEFRTLTNLTMRTLRRWEDLTCQTQRGQSGQTLILEK